MITKALESVLLGVTLGFTSAAMVAVLSKPAKSADFECKATGDGYACVSKDPRTGIDYLTSANMQGRTFALQVHCERKALRVWKNEFKYSKQDITALAADYCASK